MEVNMEGDRRYLSTTQIILSTAGILAKEGEEDEMSKVNSIFLARSTIQIVESFAEKRNNREIVGFGGKMNLLLDMLNLRCL